MTLQIDLVDYLHLEVETDPGIGERVNMVENPSGELGAWGWVTPVAGSVMVATTTPSLQYTSPGGVASWFYTENLAVANPNYVAARWMPLVVDGYYRARLEFLDASGALLSASTQTAYLNGTGTAVALGPFQAPASTAYVRLRFDHYSSTAGANPTAGQKITFNTATVAQAADPASLGVIRTNLVTNPSFESNTTGWTGTNATLARVTTQHLYETAALSITATTTAPSVSTPTGTAGFPVTAGAQYGFQANFKAATLGRSIGTRINWYTAAGALISSSAQVNVTDVTTGWTMALGNVVAPATAAFGALQVLYTSAASEVHYMDAVIVEKTTATPGPTWFDGNVAGGVSGITYAWTGTQNNSTSTATSSNLDYTDPVPYQDVLSNSTTVEISRPVLDVGTIQGVVKDATLDPAQVDSIIRPGRRVRVRALNDDTGAWDILATGKLDKAAARYDLLKPVDKQTTITLATVDANQVLANTNRSDGVATIADLPFVLEGARVPWNVNGSGNQVATATVASRNDQASALDQVVLARDSDLGYAWTTKEGVLTAYHDRTLDYYGLGTALLDESVYSGLDVSFDTADCINEVMVNYRRFNTLTGEVEEVPYGPYRDAASISEWGVHQATFTVHGMAESSVPTYANTILTANSQPAVRINSVTIPIRTAADITRARALIDLYAKVRITNTAKGLDQTLRVTRIQHAIQPKRWTMTLSFDQVDTVASPGTTTPQAGADAYLEGVWYNVGATGQPAFQNGWNNVTGYAPAAFMKKNGIVYLRGVVKNATATAIMFQLPVGFRPAYRQQYPSSTNSTAFTAGRVDVLDNGQVAWQAGGNTTYVSIACAFPADQ